MRKPTLNRTVQKAVQVEYAMLRTPLTLLDEQVLARVAEHSKLRTALERGIDKLDAAAARLLPDHRDQIEAVRAEAGADAGEQEALPAEEVEQLADVLLEEEEQRPLAGELAEDEELRRVQAELKAKHRVEQEHGS